MLNFSVRAISGAFLTIAAMTATAIAEDASPSSQHRTDLLDLKLGTPAGQLPEEAFSDYACGTDGGPPGQALRSFADFAKCPAEKSGLHEVAFRYDDEIEYRLLAKGLQSAAETNGGTKVSAFPVFASALFDDGGTLRGLRAVTDNRVALRERTNSHLMADAVQIQFGKDRFKCVDTPPGPGQTPLGGSFINQACSTVTDGVLVYTEEHFLRRAGETEISPTSGQVLRGFFDSSARLDIREPGAPLDSTGRPL